MFEFLMKLRSYLSGLIKIIVLYSLNTSHWELNPPYNKALFGVNKVSVCQDRPWGIFSLSCVKLKNK